MSLKKALDDCMIDFDRCVLVTDLLEEYKLSYKEVNDVLEAYIKEQEPATKFEKRYLVHGKRKTQDPIPAKICTLWCWRAGCRIGWPKSRMRSLSCIV